MPEKQLIGLTQENFYVHSKVIKIGLSKLDIKGVPHKSSYFTKYCVGGLDLKGVYFWTMEYFRLLDTGLTYWLVVCCVVLKGPDMVKGRILK